jgi:hypothetical protein
MSTRGSERTSFQQLALSRILFVASVAAACGPAPGTNAPVNDGSAGAPRAGGAAGASAAGNGAAGLGGAAGTSVAGTGGSAAGNGVSAGMAGSGVSMGGAGLGGAAQGGNATAGAQALGGGGAGIAGHGGAPPGDGGRGGAGGAAQAGNSGAGTAGSSLGGAGHAGGGSAGAGGAVTGPFTCNQLTGSKLSEEWFIAGFEDVVDDARWQVKWKEDAYLEEWANPMSSFWSAGIDSACANGTSAPDHIVFGVVSWKYETQAEWRDAVTQTVNTLKAKYPSALRMDLVTQIRGPNNMLCPTAPTAGETIVVPPELDAALDDVAAAFPGFVFVGPKSVAHDCSEFQGGGPHLTAAGNMANVGPFATYFSEVQ